MMQTFSGISPSGGLKEQIIYLLSKEYPLSLKKIYLRIKPLYPVTCQAVHKTLSHLVEKRVLKKSGREYELHREWIARLQDFSKKLNENYLLPKKLGEAPIMLIARTLKERADIVYKLMHTLLSETEHFSQPCIINNRRMYTLNSLNKEQRTWFEQVLPQKAEWYMLCDSDTSVDRKLSAYLKNLGFRVQFTKKNYAQTCDVIVIGDYALQIYNPEDYKKERDLLLSSRDIAEFFHKHSNFIYRSYHIPIILLKNKLLSAEIRSRTLSEFNK